MAQNRTKTTLDKVVNAIEDILDVTKIQEREPASKNGESMSMLERWGREYRKRDVYRNEWQKNGLMYTEALVRSEYEIQREFEISIPGTKAEDEQLTDAQKEQLMKDNANTEYQKIMEKAKKDSDKYKEGTISGEKFAKNYEKYKKQLAALNKKYGTDY